MCFNFLFAILSSLVVSTIIVAVFKRPLASALAELCDGQAGVNFWVVFTVLMLYLVPLFAVVLFAVPDSCSIYSVGPNFYTKLVASILGGQLSGLLVAGWQVSRFSRRLGVTGTQPRSPRRTRDDNEFWGNEDPR
jgi:hypothetical protein